MIAYTMALITICYIAYKAILSLPVKVETAELTKDEYEWCIAREESNE